LQVRILGHEIGAGDLAERPAVQRPAAGVRGRWPQGVGGDGQLVQQESQYTGVRRVPPGKGLADQRDVAPFERLVCQQS